MSIKINQQLEYCNHWFPPNRSADCLWLDLNENMILDDFIHKAFMNSLKSLNFSCYPEYDNLLELLSAYTLLPKEQIVLSNGADQAIDIVLRLCFKAGDNIIIPSPIFSYYYHVCNILGINFKPIPYIKGHEDFNFPYEDVFNELQNNPSGLILCNPNNPLGSGINSKDIMPIFDYCFEKNIPVIIDEAYFEYYNYSFSELMCKYDNIIIIRSLSKYFGLAGLRLGYILSNTYLANQMLKIRGPWDINAAAVMLGEFMLKRTDKIKIIMNQHTLSKNHLLKVFTQQNIQYYNSKTNFVLLKDKKDLSLFNQLKANRILVSNLSGYPYNFNLLDHTLRLAIPPVSKVKLIYEALDCVQEI